MKLSIIVPVYRVEATLNRCVESIVGQSFSDFELILVDDGSPDACAQLCDEWAERDARIRVVHKPNGGLSDARNAGLNVARAEKIAFVDSDDYLAPDTYQQVMPLAANCDILEFPYCKMSDGKASYTLPVKPRTYKGEEGIASYWLDAHAYEHCYAWNKIFSRRLFNEVRFPEGRVFEDAYILPKLLCHATSVATTSQGMYYYCVNPHGITATATGAELAQLLDSHLQVSWHDDRYYMHVLNIQLDVNRLTHQPPRLPRRRVPVFVKGSSIEQTVKAFINNIFGINTLCKINRTIKRHW